MDINQAVRKASLFSGDGAIVSSVFPLAQDGNTI